MNMHFKPGDTNACPDMDEDDPARFYFDQLNAIRNRANGLLDEEKWKKKKVLKNTVYHVRRIRLFVHLLNLLSQKKITEKDFAIQRSKINYDITEFLADKGVFESDGW